VDGKFLGVPVAEVLTGAEFHDFLQQANKAGLSDADFLRLPVVKQAMKAAGSRGWDKQVGQVKRRLVQGGQCPNTVLESLRLKSWNHATYKVSRVAAHLQRRVSDVAGMLVVDRPAFTNPSAPSPDAAPPARSLPKTRREPSSACPLFRTPVVRTVTRGPPRSPFRT